MSYKKVESIQILQAMGLNTHNTVITKNLHELLDAAQRMDRFTIRTDSDKRTTDLPFYIQNEPFCKSSQEDLKQFFKFVNHGLENQFYFIIADGIKHDPVQLYNGVTNIKKNGDFKVEISIEKIPLRIMYHKPTYFISGNLGDSIRDLYEKGKPQYFKKYIQKDIFDLYQHGIFGRDIEFTKYPLPVGALEEPYVFWQIRE